MGINRETSNRATEALPSRKVEKEGALVEGFFEVESEAIETDRTMFRRFERRQRVHPLVVALTVAEEYG